MKTPKIQCIEVMKTNILDKEDDKGGKRSNN